VAKKAKAAPIVYPTCVRHTKARKDVRLRHYFLCDECTAQWAREAFAGSPSLYDGEKLEGYCLLCNQMKEVRLRTWFLCDLCHRVAGAIGRNHVAEMAILDFWDKQVKPLLPHLELTRTDISSLRPRRDTDESGTAPMDFLARDTQSNNAVFGIENKTGRSAIKDMSQFQLDCSDCDTILHDMGRLNIPAYIIHAQVLEVWQPPTMGYQIVGLWWTDVYRMAAHFKSVKKRADENRGAAYFGKKAFSEMATFPADVQAMSLVACFKKDGIQPMYRSAQPPGAEPQ
jgi:hypothetical protein